TTVAWPRTFPPSPTPDRTHRRMTPHPGEESERAFPDQGRWKWIELSAAKREAFPARRPRRIRRSHRSRRRRQSPANRVEQRPIETLSAPNRSEGSLLEETWASRQACPYHPLRGSRSAITAVSRQRALLRQP